ncbi:hypothetical protein ZIOFF_039360 [Zingiber officinale]|uniref:Methylenetetrahydrofolate reductase n=1 Tax=Zingiber officinale TaxID=94328 RepID=A0A8J5L3T3_ZINOF|nr:hypothetical protein ZIOFF_039360 [Zingiber officinale]
MHLPWCWRLHSLHSGFSLVFGAAALSCCLGFLGGFCYPFCGPVWVCEENISADSRPETVQEVPEFLSSVIGNKGFETGHVLGVLLASSPLLEQAWTRCLRANAGSASFVIDKSDDAVFIGFSRAQAAASPSGLGRGFFEPVSLYSSTHKLFALLGRGEEDSGGKPQPVLLQAPYEEEAQCAALCKSDKVYMETIMHLTCMNMSVEKIDHALNTIKANGIQNVLALKGDPPHGQDKFVQVAGGFACALDLLSMEIILVSLLLEAHPDMIQGDEGATLEAYNSGLAYLKRKTLSVVLKFWKSFSHVKILELCEIFILWSANS